MVELLLVAVDCELQPVVARATDATARPGPLRSCPAGARPVTGMFRGPVQWCRC